MKRALWLALAVVVGLGCDKKSGSGAAPGTAGGDGGTASSASAMRAPEPPKPVFADTSALWAFAPPDATLGFVVGDGAGSRILTTWAAAVKKLYGKAWAKKTVAGLDDLKKQAGFDIFDEQGYKSKGIDLSKGVAIFATADLEKPALIILPIGDREAFRKLAEAKVEKVGDREVDHIDKIVCVETSGRYACAPTVEQIDAAMKPHDSPLATAVKALTPDLRGDAELFIDASKMPKVKEQLAEARTLGDFDTIGGALRIAPTASNIVGWANGTMGPMAMMLASTPPPADLAGLTANATSVFRLKFDPKLLAASGAPTTVPGPDGQQIDWAALLTGDIQIVTAGKGILAGAVLLKVTDPAKVKPIISALCAEAKKDKELPVTNLVQKDDSCSGQISLAALKDALGVELPPYKFNVAVVGNVFAVLLGDVDLATLQGSAAEETGSPEAREILTGAQSGVIWSRNFGIDLSALPKELLDKLASQPDVLDGFNMMNWSAGQAYDFAGGISLSAKGVKVLFHVTTFESDPPEARAALEAAFDQRASGDRAGYLAAMADIEKKYPTSLAGRRAKLERTGTPIVGPILGAAAGVGAGIAYFFQRMATPATPDSPSTGGGFGAPGALPPPPPTIPNQPPEPPAPPPAPQPK